MTCKYHENKTHVKLSVMTVLIAHLSNALQIPLKNQNKYNTCVEINITFNPIILIADKTSAQIIFNCINTKCIAIISALLPLI